MNKINTILLSGLLIASFQCAFAADYVTNPEGVNDVNSSFDSKVRDANFEDFSYNVSDEQLTKETATTDDLLQQDKKVSFWQKIVNSSHFSSQTATRTWIPINKAQ